MAEAGSNRRSWSCEGKSCPLRIKPFIESRITLRPGVNGVLPIALSVSHRRQNEDSMRATVSPLRRLIVWWASVESAPANNAKAAEPRAIQAAEDSALEVAIGRADQVGK